MEVKLVTDKQGNAYSLATQDQDANNCWANCIVMAENQAVRCLNDPVGRVKSILSRYKNLTVNGTMDFYGIIKVCMGEGLGIEQHTDWKTFKVFLDYTVRKHRPAIVGLKQNLEGRGMVAHVVVCLGLDRQNSTYLLLDPLATTLVELPQNQFPKYVTSYGRIWDFIGHL
jgi:hypothetical protein